ncbi:hypothetical protein EL22_07290 [Halostagnicola sp. A56]|uniref:hypothetical protein n=1 Tax=Halostagnicola sp. A56 TaxID=1495067 RepID=UPI0004A004DE|nr:hypothetical protein [Halostagnicola sp. A56]KDE58071.1 hypothetical protein EL22_07290 [Halostagnicola sp. A56]
MERLSVYTATFAVIGIIFGFNALALSATGEWGLPTLLIAIGSVVMIAGAVYELVSTDPSAFTVSSTDLLVIFVGGCLSLVGVTLEYQM